MKKIDQETIYKAIEILEEDVGEEMGVVIVYTPIEHPNSRLGARPVGMATNVTSVAEPMLGYAYNRVKAQRKEEESNG